MPNSIGMIIKKSKETCPAAEQPGLKTGTAFSKLPQKRSVSERGVAKYSSAVEAPYLFFISKQGDNTCDHPVLRLDPRACQQPERGQLCVPARGSFHPGRCLIFADMEMHLVRIGAGQLACWLRKAKEDLC